MPLQHLNDSSLKVAIIGGGPAGLGAAIEFAKLPFVEWNLYEQATAIREIGAGISVGRNTWRMLEVMGAARNLKPEDYYKAPDKHSVQHRNGRTGELLAIHFQKDIPEHQLHVRTHRAKLQEALLKEVDQSHVRLQSRLIRLSHKSSGKVLIEFQDGFKDEVDLVVGADGVRSVVRSHTFPAHRISYTGKTSYRTVISSDKLANVAGVPTAITFWHGPNAWLYTAFLSKDLFEITTMTSEPVSEKEKVSWGQDATIWDNAKHFQDFSPLVKAIVNLPTEIKQYALFAGPRLETVVAHGSIALIGDASHPLSGAFGAGAGFALEDVYALTKSISWAHEQSLSLQKALEVFDAIRGPHYHRLYKTLDRFAETDAYLDESNRGFDETVDILLEGKWSARDKWILEYDIQQIVEDTLKKENFNKPFVQKASVL